MKSIGSGDRQTASPNAILLRLLTDGPICSHCPSAGFVFFQSLCLIVRIFWGGATRIVYTFEAMPRRYHSGNKVNHDRKGRGLLQQEYRPWEHEDIWLIIYVPSQTCTCLHLLCDLFYQNVMFRVDRCKLWYRPPTKLDFCWSYPALTPTWPWEHVMNWFLYYFSTSLGIVYIQISTNQSYGASFSNNMCALKLRPDWARMERLVEPRFRSTTHHITHHVNILATTTSGWPLKGLGPLDPPHPTFIIC